MTLARSLSTVALCLALAAPARAQRANADAQLFRPPAVSGGILALDSAFVAPHLGVAGGLYFSYAHDPLVLQSASGTRIGPVIGNQLDAQLALSLSLWRRLEIGVILPVLLYQTTDDTLYPTTNGLTRTNIGDLRIDARVFFGEAHLGRSGESIGFGWAAGLGVPTGSDAAFYADSSVTFRPRLLMTVRLRPIEVSLQLGAVMRSSRTVGEVEIGQQLSYGAGVRIKVWRGLSFDGTYAGLVALTGTGGTAGAPMEFLIGPEYRWQKVPFELGAAGGRGFTDGAGSPDARVVLFLRYQPHKVGDRGDRDGDGVPDDLDACPDKVGPKENNGCPDVDSDGDGLVDRFDKCPQVPGPKENQGCPDVDSDADGIVDRLDKCPDKPGPKENEGCPDVDSDGDGIPDRLDRCPRVPGPKENQGCPDLDSDGDGIPDRLDKCPQEKETFNGIDDDDGCPDKGPELAVLTPEKIEIKQQIFFEFNKSVIKPQSYLLLATVAKILTLHPEITQIRIEGHTDTVGKHDYNVKLSQARAESVRQHLITVNGIEPNRLTAVGFGPDHPIAPNDTDEGRAKNRRSEFIIVETGKPAPAATPAPAPR